MDIVEGAAELAFTGTTVFLGGAGINIAGNAVAAYAPAVVPGAPPILWKVLSKSALAVAAMVGAAAVPEGPVRKALSNAAAGGAVSVVDDLVQEYAGGFRPLYSIPDRPIYMPGPPAMFMPPRPYGPTDEFGPGDYAEAVDPMGAAARQFRRPPPTKSLQPVRPVARPVYFPQAEQRFVQPPCVGCVQPATIQEAAVQHAFPRIMVS